MSSTIQISVNFNPPERSFGEMKAEAVTKFELQFLEMLLGRHKGNLSAAAKEVRMDRKHLHYLAKKHGLREESTTKET